MVKIVLNGARWVVAVLAVCCLGADAKRDPAEELLLTGKLDEAVEQYQGRLRKTPGDPGATIGLTRAMEARGQLAEAIKALDEADKKRPNQADLAVRRAELLLLKGQYNEAAKRMRPIVERDAGHVGARAVLGQALQAVGKYDDANTIFEGLVHYYSDASGEITSAWDLWRIGQSACAYILRNAKDMAAQNALNQQLDFVLNELYADALLAGPRFWPARVAGGLLLLERYNRPEAQKEFQAALRINPACADAHWGMGLCSLAHYKVPDARTHAKRALEINPHHVGALALAGDCDVAEWEPDGAMKSYRRALAVNPNALGVLGRLGACHLLLGQKAAYEKLKARALGVNPLPGEFFLAAADTCQARRQFPLAEAHYKEAIKAQSWLPNAHNGLGMMLMREGREREARTVLGEAFRIDPFNVRTSNMLKLLKHLDSYKTYESAHFRVRLSPQHDGVLAPYVSEHLERIYPQLVERFQHRLRDKALVEVFVSHRWFSARTVGLPWIATIGACTGKVVAVTSPRAMRKPFNWARVLTHEMTHVVTLQQTHFNIPHWYTEALAVLMEDYPRHQMWNRILVKHAKADTLLNLSNINRAFRRPSSPQQWQLAYAQAELYAEFIIDQWGWPGIARLLEAYRQGRRTPQAIPHALKVPQAAFEKRYRAYVAKVVATITVAAWPTLRKFADLEKALEKKPDDPHLRGEMALALVRRGKFRRGRELATRVLKANPKQPRAAEALALLSRKVEDHESVIKVLKPLGEQEPPDLRILRLLASAYVETKQYDEAVKLYERARRVEPQSPRWVAGLARVYALSNDDARLAQMLEHLVRMDGDDAVARRKLADLALQRKDYAEALRFGRMALEIDVFNPAVHRDVARAYAGLKKTGKAVGEMAVACRLKPDDVKLRLEHARLLDRAGRRDDAVAQVKIALEHSADDLEARKLLDALEKSARTKPSTTQNR